MLAAIPSRSVLHPAIGRLFVRGPGCGRSCSAIYGHDPITHEQYGATQALAWRARSATGVLATGPLVVDFDDRTATVNDELVRLTASEWRVLVCLASTAGVIWSHDALVRAVWGEASAAFERGFARHPYHGLRVHITRLRRKLGPASALIETRLMFGYLLRDELLDAMTRRAWEG